MHPASENALYHRGLWAPSALFPVGLRACETQSWRPRGALSQGKGHMPTGVLGHAGRRVLSWTLTSSGPRPQSPTGPGGFKQTPSGGTKGHRT